MRILIVTPAPPRSQKGNRITARRWSGILRGLGHHVRISQKLDKHRCDVLIALHAKHSAREIQLFRKRQPDSPLILALTGTDLYRDNHRFQQARFSLEVADRLVLLQPHGLKELPRHLATKARVIYQSVPTPKSVARPLKNIFEVCVIGHLRPVKDPFRTALAARRLPPTSRIRVVHLGAALSPAMSRRAEREMELNPRYHWLGERSRHETLRRLGRSRLFALTSRMEGGANAVSEAIVYGVPVISSRISGSLGLLGDDYPGYFAVSDTESLTQLLIRTETDDKFYRGLKSNCRKQRSLFQPRREQAAWKRLLAEVVSEKRPIC